MKLYYSPGACSLSPHIVLRETGSEFDLERVDLVNKRTASGGDYRKVNPKGYVPALELDDGEVITEGPAIVQYIAERKGANGLLPKAGSKERLRVQEWLNFITSELHKGFSPLFNSKVPEEYKTMAKEKLAGYVAWLNEHLAKNDYLMGSTYTVADPYLFTVLSWGKHVGLDMGQWPSVKAYLDRVAARPTVQQAMEAEGLVK